MTKVQPRVITYYHRTGTCALQRSLKTPAFGRFQYDTPNCRDDEPEIEIEIERTHQMETRNRPKKFSDDCVGECAASQRGIPSVAQVGLERGAQPLASGVLGSCSACSTAPCMVTGATARRNAAVRDQFWLMTSPDAVMAGQAG